MKLQDACADYLAYLRHEQGAAKTTCICYASYLASFQRWMQERGYTDPSLSDFNTAVLRQYLYAISGKGFRPRTIRGYGYNYLFWGHGRQSAQ